MTDLSLNKLSDKELIHKISEGTADLTKVMDSAAKRMNISNPDKVLDALAREVSWSLAICIGTLLWMLSNFDKFKIPSSTILYDKWTYLGSILCFGIAAFLFSLIQFEIYSNQFRLALLGFRVCIKSNLLNETLMEYIKLWGTYTIGRDSASLRMAAAQMDKLDLVADTAWLKESETIIGNAIKMINKNRRIKFFAISAYISGITLAVVYIFRFLFINY